MTVGHHTANWQAVRHAAPVAVGGAAGAATRWAVVALADPRTAFPWPTLLVNIVGCVLIGALTTAPRRLMLWAGIGFAGGLTTFSTFAVEVATLLDESDTGTATAYLAASVASGVVAVIFGHRMAARPRSGRRSGTLPW